MEDFGAIEDDYVNYKKKLNSCTKNYMAFNCESAWFLSSNKLENELNTIKFKADYYYYKKKYSESIECYSVYMNNATSLIVKRECLEGISRSYLALHCYCLALKYAHELHSLSSTFDTSSSSLSLLYDCTLVSQRYKDSVTYGKKLVLLHYSNSDAWLKLSLALSKFYKISLLNILPFVAQLASLLDSNSICEASKFGLLCACETCRDFDDNNCIENGMFFVVASLLYAEFHLQTIINSSVGFALPRNIKLQEMIQEEVQKLCSKDDIKTLRTSIQIIFTGVKNTNEGLNADFVDRASLKFENAEQTTCALKEFNEIEFEDKWFFFGKAV